MKARYRERYPTVDSVRCPCSRHSVGCGCLTERFISKAHTNLLQFSWKVSHRKNLLEGSQPCLNMHVMSMSGREEGVYMYL